MAFHGTVARPYCSQYQRKVSLNIFVLTHFCLKMIKNDMAGYKTLYTIEIGLGSLSQESLAIFYH